MRSFAFFIGLIVVGFLGIATLSYPAWLAVGSHFPFHRVASRIGYLVLLVGFVPILRYLRLANRRALGWGLPMATFVREFGVALALGIATMTPIVLVMTLLGLLDLRADFDPTLAALAGIALKGVLSGIFVSLGEETFTRGAMYSGIARDSGPRLAIALTAIVYASLHFVGKARIPDELVNPWSGVALIETSLHAFADPLAIVDAWLCLAAVGVLLGLVRKLTGHVAACMGLHAGWVFVITFLRQTSTPDRSNELSWLLSRFDGVVGWLVLSWCAVVGVVVYRFYARRAARRPDTVVEPIGVSPSPRRA